MPHEPFDAICNLLPVEFGEGRPDQVKRKRVHFEALRLIGIPVSPEVGAAGSALDDSNGRVDILRNFARKTKFRTDYVVDRLQVHPIL